MQHGLARCLFPNSNSDKTVELNSAEPPEDLRHSLNQERLSPLCLDRGTSCLRYRVRIGDKRQRWLSPSDPSSVKTQVTRAARPSLTHQTGASASRQSRSAGIAPAQCRRGRRQGRQAQRLLLAKTREETREQRKPQKIRQELGGRQRWQLLPRREGDVLPARCPRLLPSASACAGAGSRCARELSLHESPGWKSTRSWQRPALLVNI